MAFAPVTLQATLARPTHESLVISISCKIHLVVTALVLGLTYAQAEAKTIHIADAHHTPIYPANLLKELHFRIFTKSS